MWIYWSLILVPAVLALNAKQQWKTIGLNGQWPLAWKGTFCVLSLILGLRHNVGGDWLNYEFNLSSASELSLSEMLEFRFPFNDAGYGLIEWFGAQWGGIYLANTICACIFCWGLVAFCLAQPRPWLALVVAVPYLIMVLGMGYTRQGVALSFVMLGFVALENKQIKRFIILIMMAASFHKSAVLLIFLAALGSNKYKIYGSIALGLLGVILYYSAIREYFEYFYLGYVEAEYKSSGTWVRLSMNAVPAALFLSFQRVLRLSSMQRSLWTWLSLVSLGLLGLMLVSPSSTAVDRVALYLLPVQLFVWSRFPDFVYSGHKKAMEISIVVYALLSHYVWLNYADHSWAWIPYHFLPLVWLRA